MSTLIQNLNKKRRSNITILSTKNIERSKLFKKFLHFLANQTEKLEISFIAYPTRLLLRSEEWCALERVPLDADDHGFQWPKGDKARMGSEIRSKSITETKPQVKQSVTVWLYKSLNTDELTNMEGFCFHFQQSLTLDSVIYKTIWKKDGCV